MNANGTILTVSVYHRSFFARSVKPKAILLDGMHYGITKKGRFYEGEVNGSETVAWHEDHIGRGIRIRWKDDDIRFTELTLSLPASTEEIDDFFLMSARLARQDISEVLLNGKPFVPKEFHKHKDAIKVQNLRLLHDMMGDVLNNLPRYLALGCAFHRLAAGEAEAETMWAGVTTDALRDWLHNAQKEKLSFAEAEVEQEADGAAAWFTLPSDTALILPDHCELPLRMYDLTTGKPKFPVRSWSVRLLDSSAGHLIGQVPFDKIHALLPKEKVSYYDAADHRIAPLSVTELEELAERAKLDDDPSR